MAFRPRMLVLQQGKTLTKPFRRRYRSNNAVINFADHSATKAKLQVRDKAASDGGVVLVELTTENGGIALGKYTDTNGKEWSGQLSMSAAATASLVPWGEAIYELVVYDPAGTWTKTIFFGSAILVPAATVV